MQTLLESLSEKTLRLFMWLVFAFGVLAIYYRRVWTLFDLGLFPWVQSNISLSTALRPLWFLLKSGRLVVELVAFPEAMERSFLAFWGAGLVLICSSVLGTLLLKLLSINFQDWREAILYRISVGFGALSNLLLGLAVLGQYRPPMIQFLVAGITSGGVLWLIYDLRFHGKNLKIKPNHRRIDPEAFWKRIWQTISLLAVITAITGALAPEIEFDALRYHLWLPKLWLENGSPVDLVNEYISLYPLSWELLFGIAMVLGNSVAAKLLHFTTFPLSALLVYQLTRRFIPRASPWLSMAIFTTIPTVLWEATTAYIDLALALHVGLTIYALLRYSAGRRRQWLALAGLNLGFALATKHLALLILVLTSIGLAWKFWLDKTPWRRSLFLITLFVGFSLLIAFPWYFRSWLASGNPVFPDLFDIFGAFPAERWNDLTEQGLTAFKNHFGYPRTLINLFLLPWNMTIHAARFGGDLGPIFLILIPGFLWHRFRTPPVSWLMAFVAGFMAMWASPISSFQMRFIVAITPILAILASLAFKAFIYNFTPSQWQRALASTVLAGLLILNFPPFTSLHESDRSNGEGWLTHVIHELPLKVVIGAESEQAYLERKIPSYKAWQYINHTIPLDGLILTFSDGDHFYSDRPRLWRHSPLATSIIQKVLVGNGKEAIEDLRKIGVRYVLFDKQELGGVDPGASMLRDIGQFGATFEPLYNDNFFILNRIK